MRLVLLLNIIIIGNLAFSQNAINLLNGRTINYDSYSINSARGYLKYSYIDKIWGKERTKMIDLTNIFSIKDDFAEIIVYKPFFEEEITVDKMKYVVSGSQDAFEYHKTWLVAMTGFLMGVTPMLLKIEFLLSLAIPLTYSSASFLLKPNEFKALKNMPPEFDAEYYFLGYENTAVHQNFKHALYGSAAGVVLGVIILITVNSISSK